MTESRAGLGPMHNVPRWYLVITLVWSAVMLALPWVVVVTLGDRLPDPVATHWGTDGAPDGFTPLAVVWIWPVVGGGLTVALLVGLGLVMRQLRPLAPVTMGMTTFLGVLIAGSLAAQADGAATDASLDAALLWSILAGVVVGVGAALLARRLAPVPVGRRTGGLPATAPRLSVPPGTRLSWTGRTRTSRGAVFAGWAFALLFAPIALLFAVNDQWTMMGLMLGLGVLIGALFLAFFGATVLVDADGVSVRALDRFTMITIPLAQIEQAAAVVVHWGDFGGVGLRAGIGAEGATGLITSSGEAVRIDRAGRGPFFVTLDPADEVAATINTLIALDSSAPTP